MRGIFRKAVADTRGRPLQSLLMVLVIGGAAATLSLALNVQASASRPADRLREQTNGADLWVDTVRAGSDFEALKRLPEVLEVSGPYPVSWTNYGVREGDKKQQLALVGMPPELPSFDHPAVTDGRWLSSGGRDEIVIDRGAARRLGLEAGQRIELLTPFGPRPFTIVGLAVASGRAPAPINDPAFAYVLPETLQALEPEAVFGASEQYPLRAGVRLRDPDAVGPFLRSAQPALIAFASRSWADVRQNLSEANQFDLIFLNVFSIFALISAGFIIANAVGGQVLSQTRDTGILKAIGFTPAQVTLSLLAQNLALSLAGGALGAGVGLLVAPFFLERTADVLGVPASAAFNAVLLTITLAVVCLVVLVFTLLPAWRAGRVPAVKALNAGNDDIRVRPSRLSQVAARLGAPRVFVVGLKDLSRRPLRTAMTIGAIALAVVTATFSLAIESTFEATKDDFTVIGGPPADIGVDRDAFPDAEARRILDSRPEVESYLVVYNYDGIAQREGFDVKGFEGDLNEPRWAMRGGRMPTSQGEAAVSTRMASRFGLEVGDVFEFQLAGARNAPPTSVTIVGELVYIEGAALFVTRETLPAHFPPSDYNIVVRPGTDQDKFSEALIADSGGYLDPEILDETIGEIQGQFRSVLLGLNAVLFAIAGLNLLSSMLLSIRERRRDFAVLKTIGFTPGQVASSVFAGSALLAAAAVVVGIPLGLVASKVMFDLLSNAAGIGSGVGRLPGPLWLLPLVPAAIAIAALGTVFPARRAAGVQVAEALRYE
jgi:putative ABC transport system permease protein